MDLGFWSDEFRLISKYAIVQKKNKQKNNNKTKQKTKREKNKQTKTREKHFYSTKERRTQTIKNQTFSVHFSGVGGGGYSSENLSGGVWNASLWNPFPISDQYMRIPYPIFRPDLKIDTLLQTRSYLGTVLVCVNIWKGLQIVDVSIQIVPLKRWTITMVEIPVSSKTLT